MAGWIGDIAMSVQAGHGETTHVPSDVPVLMYHSISTGEVARQFRRFVTDPALHARNAWSLRRLRHEVEQRARSVS